MAFTQQNFLSRFSKGLNGKTNGCLVYNSGWFCSHGKWGKKSTIGVATTRCPKKREQFINSREDRELLLSLQVIINYQAIRSPESLDWPPTDRTNPWRKKVQAITEKLIHVQQIEKRRDPLLQTKLHCTKMALKLHKSSPCMVHEKPPAHR